MGCSQAPAQWRLVAFLLPKVGLKRARDDASNRRNPKLLLPVFLDPFSFVYTKKKMDPEKRAKEVLGSVGLTHRLSHVSNQLSGGEKQRVAIARALVNNPSIIFADEPTGNLDSKSGKQVMEILQDLNDDGKTIILVTHEKYTAEHAKRILRIKDGNIVSDESVGKRVIAKSEKELTK